MIPMRGLVNDQTRKFLENRAETRDKPMAGALTKEKAQLPVERLGVGALQWAVVNEDIETGSVMAWQSVEMVTSVQPLAEVKVRSQPPMGGGFVVGHQE